MKIELICLILMLACHELADALAAPLGDSDCRKGLKWCRQALVVAPLENVGNTVGSIPYSNTAVFVATSFAHTHYWE